VEFIHISRCQNGKFTIRVEPTEEYWETESLEDLIMILRQLFDNREKEQQ